MICVNNISDSLGHYMHYIKPGNDFACHLRAHISAQRCDCTWRELGYVTVLGNLSLYNHPEHCCEILSHTTLGSRLEI